MHFSERKSLCCKVSLCENFQRQRCKAFTSLSNRAQTFYTHSFRHLRRLVLITTISVPFIYSLQGGGVKRKVTVLRTKVDFFLEENLLQNFFVRELSAHSCKACNGLSNSAQIVGGGRPLLPEILWQIDHPSKRYSLVAPQP